MVFPLLLPRPANPHLQPQFVFILFFFLLATLHCLWDLSSPARDWTQVHSSKSTETSREFHVFIHLKKKNIHIIVYSHTYIYTSMWNIFVISLKNICSHYSHFPASCFSYSTIPHEDCSRTTGTALILLKKLPNIPLCVNLYSTTHWWVFTVSSVFVINATLSIFVHLSLCSGGFISMR